METSFPNYRLSTNVSTSDAISDDELSGFGIKCNMTTFVVVNVVKSMEPFTWLTSSSRCPTLCMRYSDDLLMSHFFSFFFFWNNCSI
jgi:hypothetical protein